MPRAAVRLKPAVETPPEWWAAEWVKRQSRARCVIVRILKKADRAISQGELLSAAGGYGSMEGKCAINTLVAAGVVRRFFRHEPFTTAFKTSLGCKSKMVDRIYYELTEQP